MKHVLIDITVHARGEMATKLLEAADELGMSPLVVKTTSEGFRVPIEIHQHLFPSLYKDRDPEESDPGDASTGDETIVHTEDVPDEQVPALAAAMKTQTPADDTRYDELDFPSLREHAKERGLSGAGTADEIRARLRAADDQGE